MSIHPPHLPPKVCNLIFRKRWQRIVIILTAVCVSFFSGVAASLVSTAWLIPNRAPEVTPVQLTQKNRIPMDAATIQQVRQRMVTVYDARKKIGTAVYREDAKIASAALISRDGWAVMHMEQYIPGIEWSWEVIDHQGTAHSIDQIIRDPYSDLMYVHLASGVHRGDVRFAEALPEEGSTLWNISEEESIQRHIAGYTQERPQVRAIWDGGASVRLIDETAKAGELLFEKDGTFVGIAGKAQEIIPAWRIRQQLPRIFAGDAPQFTGLPWFGHPVGRVFQEDGWQQITGFYITRADRIGTSTPVMVGDIVLKIGEEGYHPHKSPTQILQSDPPLRITVLRKGEEVTVETEKAALR